MKYNFEMIWNGYTLCPENWGMENEIATFHRVYYVYGGEAYCKYKGKTIQLQPGHLYLFPVMSPYTLWQNKENPLDVLWFHVEMEICLCMDFLSIEIEKDSILSNLLESMRLLTDDAEHYEELLEIFGVFIGFVAEKTSLGVVRNKKMERVIKYIDSHIDDVELDVEQLANFVVMDRASFSRKFKKYVNLAPKQYIYAKRMNKAAIELAQGASVYQAARMTGYLDEKSFARAFKRYMEETPSDYRKKRVEMP